MEDMPLHDAILIENGAVTRVNRIVRAIERNKQLADSYVSSGLTPKLVKVAEETALARRAQIYGSDARGPDGRWLGRKIGQSPFSGQGRAAKELAGRSRRGVDHKSKTGKSYNRAFVKLTPAAKMAIAKYLGIGAAYARGVERKKEHLYGTTSGLTFGSKQRSGRWMDEATRKAKHDELYGARGAAGSDKAYRQAKRDLRARFKGAKGAEYYTELSKLRSTRPAASKYNESALVGKDGARYAPKSLKSTRAKSKGAAQARQRAEEAAMKKFGAQNVMLNNPFGYDDLALVTNPSGIGFLDSIESTVESVPVVGGVVAPLITPAALGAAAFGVHFVAVPYIEKVLPSAAKPFAYTIGGSAVGIVAGLVAKNSADSGVRTAASLIGGTAVAIGVGLDLFRKYGGAVAGDDEFGALALENPGVFGALALENPGVFGALALENPGVFGDGMAYELGPVGGFGFDGESANLLHGYAAASLADAYFSGPDFDAVEGEALLSGPAEFRRVAGPVPMAAAGQRRAHSNLAGRRFHRWGWLIKLVGFQNAQKIAAMSPEERLRVVDALRKQALETFQRELSALNKSHAALPAGIAASAPMAPAAAPGVGDTFGYGALAVADY